MIPYEGRKNRKLTEFTEAPCKRCGEPCKGPLCDDCLDEGDYRESQNDFSFNS